MSQDIRVFIVDDHEIFRNGLKMVIGKLGGMTVVGEAGNGKEFLEKIEHTEADVILMDIEMPVMNGIEATARAMEEDPDRKIIALTMFNDDEYIQSMMDAGVMGFLIKNVSRETLKKAIETVHGGGNYYSEELFRFFTRQLSREPRKDEPDLHLTRREKEILQLLCEGLSNKEIADVLCVSERTVVGHKSNLLSKTGCKNTLSLLSYAIKNKLVVI
ncbi:MAG: response regulator [Bacteroidales bacterium]